LRRAFIRDWAVGWVFERVLVLAEIETTKTFWVLAWGVLKLWVSD
jgi:hypothetical protein